MPVPSILRPGNLQNVSDVENQQRPIDYIIDRIASIRSDPLQPPILILKSDTGSGKTTTLPPELYFRFKGLVTCTQPRILTAILTARESVPKIFPGRMQFGVNVGVQTSVLNKSVKEGVMFVTLGSIVNAIQTTDPIEFFKKYPIIVLDEAHERSTDLDITMLIIKKYARLYPRAMSTIIITSATITVEKYTAYFELPPRHAVLVAGMTYPVTYFPAPHDISNYIYKVVDLVSKICNDNPITTCKYPDIFIFISHGIPQKMIMDNLAKLKEKRLLILKMDRATVTGMTRDFRLLSADLSKWGVDRPDRRVIVGTNVMETGLTVDTAGFVIDTGYFRSVEYNPYYNCKCTFDKPETRFSAKQRAGRVGRTSPGNYYPMMRAETLAALNEANLADFVKSDAAREIMVAKQFDDVAQIDPATGDLRLSLLDPIPQELMRSVEDKLYALGFMMNGVMTRLGDIATKIPRLSVESIRMVMAGYAHGICVADLITVAAGIESGIKVSTTIEVADQFLDILFLVEEWTRNMAYNSNFAELLTARVAVMEAFAIIGISPHNAPSLLDQFPNRSNAAFGMAVAGDPDLDDLLRRFKMCVYEGYKLNLLTRTVCADGVIKYINLRGIEVRVNNLYDQPTTRHYDTYGIDNCRAPHMIVAAAFLFKRPMGKPVHILTAQFLCVLDGFVGVDAQLFLETPTATIQQPVSWGSLLDYTSMLPRGRRPYDAALFNGKLLGAFKFVGKVKVDRPGDGDRSRGGFDNDNDNEDIDHDLCHGRTPPPDPYSGGAVAPDTDSDEDI